MNIVRNAAAMLIVGTSFLLACNYSGDIAANKSGKNNQGVNEGDEDFPDDAEEINTIEIAYLNAGIAFATDLETSPGSRFAPQPFSKE